MGAFIYILLCAFLGWKVFLCVSFSPRNIIFIKIVMKEISLKEKATRVRAMRMFSEPAENRKGQAAYAWVAAQTRVSTVWVWISVLLFTSYITEQVTQLLCVVPCLENRNVNDSTCLTGLFWRSYELIYMKHLRRCLAQSIFYVSCCYRHSTNHSRATLARIKGPDAQRMLDQCLLNGAHWMPEGSGNVLRCGPHVTISLAICILHDVSFQATSMGLLSAEGTAVVLVACLERWSLTVSGRQLRHHCHSIITFSSGLPSSPTALVRTFLVAWKKTHSHKWKQKRRVWYY